jgi:hypothetical protein
MPPEPLDYQIVFARQCFAVKTHFRLALAALIAFHDNCPENSFCQYVEMLY